MFCFRYLGHKLLLTLMVLHYSDIACAQSVNWSADLLTKLAKHSNLLLATEEPLEIVSKEVEASMVATKSSPLSDTKFSLEIKRDSYSKEKALEQDENSLLLQHSSRGEKYTYSVSGNLSEATTLGYAEDTGEVIRFNIPVRSSYLSADYLKNFSESIALGVDVRQSFSRYKFGGAGLYQDTDNLRLDISSYYTLDDNDQWALVVYKDINDQVDNGLVVDTLGIQMQRNYSINDLWSIIAKYGKRDSLININNEFSSFRLGNTSGRVYSLSLTRKMESGSLGIDFGEDLSIRSTGSIDVSKRVNGWINYSLSERSSSKFVFSVIDRAPIEFSSDGADASRVLNISSNFRYLFSQHLSLNLDARWAERSFTALPGDIKTNGSSFSVGIFWQIEP
jgi:hypothetical protein